MRVLGWARVGRQRQRAVQFLWLPDPAQRCLCCIRLGVWRHSAGDWELVLKCWTSSRVGQTGPLVAPGKMVLQQNSIQGKPCRIRSQVPGARGMIE